LIAALTLLFMLSPGSVVADTEASSGGAIRIEQVHANMPQIRVDFYTNGIE
jgi:hypothetical protein